MAPAVSPPVNKTQEQSQQSCVRFAARTCDATKPSQKWHLMSGVKPGDGKPTTIRSSIPRNATCMQVENGAKISADYDSITNGAHGGCKSKLSGPDGCKSLPPLNGYNGTNACDYDQAFVFNANGTVALCKTTSNMPLRVMYEHILTACLRLQGTPGPCMTTRLRTCISACRSTRRTAALACQAA